MGGIKDEIVGGVKEKVGHMTGNVVKEEKGREQKVIGQIRQEEVKQIEQQKGAAEELYGNVKSDTGRVTGNTRMTIEGKATEMKGRARQAMY